MADLEARELTVEDIRPAGPAVGYIVTAKGSRRFLCLLMADRVIETPDDFALYREFQFVGNVYKDAAKLTPLSEWREKNGIAEVRR